MTMLDRMKKETFATRWAILVTGHPLVFVFLGLCLAMGLGYGGKFITISSDYRYFFGEENPQRLAFEKLQNVYSKDDSTLFVITPKDGEVFKKSTLAGIRFLTERAWQLPYSRRVDSITNFQHSYAEGDDLIVKDLVTEEELADPEKALSFKRLKEIALAEPLLRGLSINEGASVTSVNVLMTFPGKHSMEIPEAVAEARKLVIEFKEKYPGHEVHLSGDTMLNNAFNEAGVKDMTTLTPAMYGVIILIMFILLRSVSAVFATFVVMLLSIVGGMGFAGWMETPITPPSSIAPVVIMTLAIADSIHILKSILEALRKGRPKRDAIVEGLRLNLKPVFLTSATTIVGFLSLNFSDTPPFHDLGNITSVGVAMAFVLSVTVLPGIIMLLPLKARKADDNLSQWGSVMGSWVTQRRGPIAIISLLTTIIIGLQIPKIELNDEFIGYFSEDNTFRVDSDYTMKNLTGIYQINFDLKSGESQGVADPAFLAKVEEFANFLRDEPMVTHVNSITDVFKRLNKNMHADEEAQYKLPEARDLAAQYLLLYEMSLPYGLDLNNQVDVDKSSTRLTANLGFVSTSEIIEIVTRAENWLKSNSPENMHTLATSPVIMFSHISHRNVVAMLKGTLLAFGLITLVMILALGSVKYGLLSLIPNLVPIVLGYGLWALFVGEAGFTIAIVGSVTLGIVVDDSVHFLTKFNLARREKGLSVDEAVHYAFENVGGALVVTSVILVIGFAVLMLSAFKMNYILGALSALTIGLALLIDFTLLPAVLSFCGQKKTKK
ncbi:MAG: RND transporter [Opitutae bacterium]|nr:RND transporter [Opitutae bacterium]